MTPNKEFGDKRTHPELGENHERITVRVPEDLCSEVDDVAEKQETSRSEVVRKSLKRFILLKKRQDSPVEYGQQNKNKERDEGDVSYREEKKRNTVYKEVLENKQ